MATATAAAVQEEPATRFAKDQLKAIIERIERLEEEKKAISDDIRDVYAESKGNGFDVKALRAIVRMRKLADGRMKILLQGLFRARIATWRGTEPCFTVSVEQRARSSSAPPAPAVS